jgi:hypothetical protein
VASDGGASSGRVHRRDMFSSGIDVPACISHLDERREIPAENASRLSARSNSIGDDRRKLNQQIIDIIMVNS